LKKKVTLFAKRRYLMRITKRFLLSAALLSVLSSRADVYGKSYLSIRPRFELTFPERVVMFRDKMNAREDGRGGAFELVGFFGNTTNPSDIAKYFLPNCKDFITVGEDASESAVSRTRDINAFNLGVLTDDILNPATYDEVRNDGYTNLTFESKVTFCPQQKMCGLGLAYQQRLPNKFWFDIAAPIIRVKNILGVKEYVLNEGGDGNPDVPTGYFANALCALGDCNTARKYGRIVSRSMKKTRVSQIELRVGRSLIDDESLVGGFAGVYIPTGNKPTAYYLFEPVVGNNQHWGVIFGGYGKFELLRDDRDRTFNTVYNAATRYFAPNHQRRSFDLKDRAWSRYLKVWKSDNDNTDVAIADLGTNVDYLINYSTLCVKVKPYYSYDFNFGLNYTDRGFKMEVGYNLYARKAEEVCFDHPMKGEVGLMALRYYLDDPDSQGEPRTYQGAQIGESIFKVDIGSFVDDVINVSGPDVAAAYVPITVNDLDPMSGAAPASISQTIYGSMGYEWNDLEFPAFLNGGLSYEFTNDNTSVRRWTAWLKLGFSI